MRRVIVVGLDGFEPRIAEAVPPSGELPNLARLRESRGYDTPSSVQGKSLVGGKTLAMPAEAVISTEDEAILRERLSGLGYLS